MSNCTLSANFQHLDTSALHENSNRSLQRDFDDEESSFGVDCLDTKYRRMTLDPKHISLQTLP